MALLYFLAVPVAARVYPQLRACRAAARWVIELHSPAGTPAARVAPPIYLAGCADWAFGSTVLGGI